MEILIIIAVIGGFGYVIYKIAKSKNREPSAWILAAFLLSPIIVLIILACMQKLPKQKGQATTRTKDQLKKEDKIFLVQNKS